LLALIWAGLYLVRPGIRSSRGPGGSDGHRWNDELLLVWLASPVALAAALSIVWPMFIGRYLIVCVPAICLVAARGAMAMRAQKWLLSAALVLLAIAMGKSSIDSARFARDDYRGAVGYVERCHAPDDLVVTLPKFPVFNSISSITGAIQPWRFTSPRKRPTWPRHCPTTAGPGCSAAPGASMEPMSSLRRSCSLTSRGWHGSATGSKCSCLRLRERRSP
jgi:hypothetical protein